MSPKRAVTLLISVVGAVGYSPGCAVRERLREAVMQRAFALYTVVVALWIIIDIANG